MVICMGALLAVLAPVVYLGGRWIEYGIHHYFEYPAWHEPLDGWSLQ